MFFVLTQFPRSWKTTRTERRFELQFAWLAAHGVQPVIVCERQEYAPLAGYPTLRFFSCAPGAQVPLEAAAAGFPALVAPHAGDSTRSVFLARDNLSLMRSWNCTIKKMPGELAPGNAEEFFEAVEKAGKSGAPESLGKFLVRRELEEKLSADKVWGAVGPSCSERAGTLNEAVSVRLLLGWPARSATCLTLAANLKIGSLTGAQRSLDNVALELLGNHSLGRGKASGGGAAWFGGAIGKITIPTMSTIENVKPRLREAYPAPPLRKNRFFAHREKARGLAKTAGPAGISSPKG